MKEHIFKANLLVICLAVWFVIIVFSIQLRAYAKNSPDTVYNHFWTTVDEYSRTSQLRYFLIDNGWCKDYIDNADLDYILILTQQLCEQYERVRPELALAMIAVESRFDTNAHSGGGARGLMQLIPAYHEDRLIQFLEADDSYSRDLFYNPRLNIATGLDYINYILGETKGGEALALMWYNQGAVSADKTWNKGITSSYAKTVLSLADDIEDILGERNTYVSCPS